jgi:hypothetical protein
MPRPYKPKTWGRKTPAKPPVKSPSKAQPGGSGPRPLVKKRRRY